MTGLVDLHLHLPGTVRAETFAELASASAVSLPLPAPELYTRINSDPTESELSQGPWFPLLRVYEMISLSLRTRDHFSRVVFEALEDAKTQSNAVYVELAFSPSEHMKAGVPYAEIRAGIEDGFARARGELNVDGRAIAAVNREDSPQIAREMVATVAADPSESIPAIGLDFYELGGMPEKFVDAFRLAKSAGLGRTAHAGEHAPTAETVQTALDALGCDRIDHGYQILRDPRIVDRCAQDGIIFNVAFTTSRRALIPWRRESIAAMVDAGLRVTINSDDPSLFPTTLAREFAIADEVLGADRRPWLLDNAVDASFLPADQRTKLRAVLKAPAHE